MTICLLLWFRSPPSQFFNKSTNRIFFTNQMQSFFFGMDRFITPVINSLISLSQNPFILEEKYIFTFYQIKKHTFLMRSCKRHIFPINNIPFYMFIFFFDKHHSDIMIFRQHSGTPFKWQQGLRGHILCLDAWNMTLWHKP